MSGRELVAYAVDERLVEEFVLQLVETSTGRAVPPDIWNETG